MLPFTELPHKAPSITTDVNIKEYEVKENSHFIQKSLSILFSDWWLAGAELHKWALSSTLRTQVLSPWKYF